MKLLAEVRQAGACVQPLNTACSRREDWSRSADEPPMHLALESQQLEPKQGIQACIICN